MKKLTWIDCLTCVFLLALAALMIAGAMVVGSNEFTLSLELLGQPEMTLEYGSEFLDPGVTADFRGTVLMTEGAEPEITVEGEVDTSVVGAYTVTYHAKYWNYTKSVSRTVRIVDTQLPVITLESTPGHYTLPGREYQEEGYTAYDDYDGDLTNQVACVVMDGEVIYSVADSSGNETHACRAIFYDDPVPPEITLVDGAHITIYPGTEYVDPGFTAIDNCDGDITANVTVEGSVDIWLPGDYEFVYTVSDSHGNQTTVVRTVTVQMVTYTGGTNGKTICLTFDDGPSEHTAVLLDILKKYNVKATFFMVNTRHIRIATRVAEEGHTVAIHAARHKFSEIYVSEEVYFADLYWMQDIIRSLTGTKPKLVRFPGGTSNTVSKYNPGIMTRLTKLLKEKGFRYCDWNVDSGDAVGATTEEEVFQNVIKGIKKKDYAIVLQHDTHLYSVRAAERIIVWGIVNGYSFEKLTERSPLIQHAPKN